MTLKTNIADTNRAERYKMTQRTKEENVLLNYDLSSHLSVLIGINVSVTVQFESENAPPPSSLLRTPF